MSHTPDTNELRDLLASLQRGETALEEALERLSGMPLTADRGAIDFIDGVHLDVDRQRRCGFPEVIFAEGKSAQTVVDVFARQKDLGQESLATRVSPEQAHWLIEELPEAIYNVGARTVRISRASELAGRVPVITAGTSDRAVAEEALETLHWMHCGCELIVDIGVAGPQRLFEQLPRLDGADAVVVVAGMEGALPSVIGGWVDCPVIAVPTSVGYGASLGGLSALLGMLNSCAANVTVVNIDAGFKAGYVAGMIARRLSREGT